MITTIPYDTTSELFTAGVNSSKIPNIVQNQVITKGFIYLLPAISAFVL